jgi:hypothetical protein
MQSHSNFFFVNRLSSRLTVSRTTVLKRKKHGCLLKPLSFSATRGISIIVKTLSIGLQNLRRVFQRLSMRCEKWA